MTTLPIKNYDVNFSNLWYGDITDDQIRSALFESKAFGDVDHDNNWCLITFDDLRAEFDRFASLTPEEQIEEWGEDLPDNYTVYDWIRDCMMNTLSVVESIKRKEC